MTVVQVGSREQDDAAITITVAVQARPEQGVQCGLVVH